MSLYIEEEGSVTLPFDTEEIAIAVTAAALDYAECPYEAEINLLLTENQEIHEMNLEQRGIDRPTDVLSFPMIEYDAPGDFSVIDEETGDAFNPDVQGKSPLSGRRVWTFSEKRICIFDCP